MGKTKYNPNRKHKAKQTIACAIAMQGGKRVVAAQKFFIDLSPAFNNSPQEAARAFNHACAYVKKSRICGITELSPQSLSEQIGTDPVQAGLLLRVMESVGILKAVT